MDTGGESEIKLVSFVGIASLALSISGFLGFIGVLSFFGGTKAVGLSTIAIISSTYVVIGAQLGEKKPFWVAIGLVSMGIASAVLLCKYMS